MNNVVKRTLGIINIGGRLKKATPTMIDDPTNPLIDAELWRTQEPKVAYMRPPDGPLHLCGRRVVPYNSHAGAIMTDRLVRGVRVYLPIGGRRWVETFDGRLFTLSEGVDDLREFLDSPGVNDLRAFLGIRKRMDWECCSWYPKMRVTPKKGAPSNG